MTGGPAFTGKGGGAAAAANGAAGCGALVVAAATLPYRISRKMKTSCGRPAASRDSDCMMADSRPVETVGASCRSGISSSEATRSGASGGA